jgi:hypothetical protein
LDFQNNIKTDHLVPSFPFAFPLSSDSQVTNLAAPGQTWPPIDAAGKGHVGELPATESGKMRAVFPLANRRNGQSRIQTLSARSKEAHKN